METKYIEKVKEINKGKNLKYYILTMGCQLNENDSEKLCGMVEEMGYQPTEEYKEADLVIFNTCCVRENAEDKLFGKLGELKKVKETRGTIIAIGGCMMQEKHITDKIHESYSYTDIIFGTHTLQNFPEDLYKTLETKKKQQDILDIDGEVYEGTVLEHMLMQHLTSFYDVGEHNHIRLRGADWNDGLDMADERGESVAFTALYGGNLGNMAKLIKSYADMTGNETVELAKEMLLLLNVDPTVYDSIDEKHEVLYSYCEQVKHSVSGEKVNVKCTELCTILNRMSQWIAEHIRNTEWIKSKDGYSWFNGYYDNHGNAVDGDFESGVRMMITAQVFTIMAGTATKEQIKDITAAADKYLYDEKVGGYRLNTDFKEVKTDLGRLFGFAYGHKENGAVFCHMATMYANALYQRGFAKEGYQVINTLFKHCNDYKVSGIYPGVPEYISQRGRGMYHYLTGAASWMLLTVLNEMYGVKGEIGALKFKPKLLAKQFENGEASVSCMFRGTNIHVTYKNGMCKDAGDYKVAVIYIDGQRYGETDTIAKEDVDKFGDKADIVVVLQ